VANDRPTVAELLEAVRHFIATDVVPALEGKKQFHARVAANVIAIVQRELALEDEQLRGEWLRLNRLLGSETVAPANRAAMHRQLEQRTETLCERIRAGDADSGAWRTLLLEHVRQTVIDKLAVAKPGFAKG